MYLLGELTQNRLERSMPQATNPPQVQTNEAKTKKMAPDRRDKVNK